jgi:hypothetical protein
VDEAGDGTLFGKTRGGPRPIVGTEGCSGYFILGVVDIPDYDALSTRLLDLRMELLKDPFFRKVPSMQMAARKTALVLHAKDDLPEVRYRVFSLLREHDLRFFATVKNKLAVLEYVRQRNSSEPPYRYSPNELYDYMVRRLFNQLLHKHDAYDIYIARRGKSDRTQALKTALLTAQRRFEAKWRRESRAAINVVSYTPLNCAGLQVVDYLLWSLQRFYERREDRYLEYMWPAFRLVIDIDDTRKTQYGAYYTQQRPLTLDALEESQGI